MSAVSSPLAVQSSRAVQPEAPRYAAFVTPHGFGHGARASAVMEAVHARNGAGWEIFSTVPEWFFEESLAGLFRYHRVVCDVGFAQRSALEFDLDATVAALRDLVPFNDALVDDLARAVVDAGCRAVLCDIAPLGIAVAERAGLPSMLVENFSWPWLYEPLWGDAPELERFGDQLSRWSARATVHVQTEPLCVRDESADAFVGPISRRPRRSRAAVRAELALDDDLPVVVVTMGGVPHALPFLDRLRAMDHVTFLVTGVPADASCRNLRTFSNDSPIFMPDFLRASDAVVAKLGYGTIAEVWREGVPFGSVTRANSREMPALEAFVAREISGFCVRAEDFEGGDWVDRIPELLEMPRRPREPGAADEVAAILAELGKAAQ